MKLGDEIIFKIDDWTLEGMGVGHVDGMAVFVDGGVIGDTVSAKILKIKKNYVISKFLKIIQESELRRKSPCKYASVCSGCDIIEMKPEEQVKWKKKKIENDFSRLGKTEISVNISSFEEFGYRNKVTFRLSKDGKLAYTKRKSNDTFEVYNCLVAAAEIQSEMKRWNEEVAPLLEKNSLCNVIRAVVFKSNYAEEIMIVIITDIISEKIRSDIFECVDTLKPEVLCACANKRMGDISISNPVYYTENKVLNENLFGYNFKVSPQSFFQVNKYSREALYSEAFKLFSNIKNRTVLDLYSGTGTTSLLIAKEAKKVVGVEIVESAVNDAKNSAKRNNVKNVDFRCGKAEDMIDSLIEETDADAILVDPPRKGLDRKVVEAINNSSIKEIVYISCNTTTLARDVSLFKEPGFEVKSVIGIDQFANSGHVECIALIQRVKS